MNGLLRSCDTGADTYHAELFKVLERVEDENFWFRSRNRLIQWALDRYFAQAESLLEVGCATGFVLSASGRCKRRKRAEHDFADEFRIAPELNRALQSVMTAEPVLIRAGASLPAGGSLRAVARKADS